MKKLNFSWICSFYYCLLDRGWDLKVSKQFAIWGQVDYKLVAYKKAKFSQADNGFPPVYLERPYETYIHTESLFG